MNFKFRNYIKNLSTTQKGILNSLITRSWGIISGPLTLFFIPIFLSPEDQGMWFTFISLSALSVFADLGFSAIVLQFSAHEFAFLKYENGLLQGDEIYLDRISSLFKFVLRWAGIMILVVFPIITFIGLIIFSQKTESFYWLIPWVIYLVASSGNLFVQILSSFLQGCNQVARIQKLTLYFAITSTISVLSLLYFKFGLYALSISLLASVLVLGILIYRSYHKLIFQLLSHNSKKHNWKSELLPLIGRYAISFISGYLVSQIYTPLVFQFKGAVAAGQVGLTISLLSALYSISFVWFVAMTPNINFLVAKKQWVDLDKVFYKTLILSVSTFILGCLFVVISYCIFEGHWQLVNKIRFRFLGFYPLLMLSVGYLLQILFSGSAVYLRAHKKEVYVFISMSMAIYILMCTYFIAKFLPISYIFVGHLTSYFLFGYFIYKIFRKYQFKWHSSEYSIYKDQII